MKTKTPLLIKSKTNSDVYQSITKESANWNYLSFEARILNFNEQFLWDTDEKRNGNCSFKWEL